MRNLEPTGNAGLSKSAAREPTSLAAQLVERNVDRERIVDRRTSLAIINRVEDMQLIRLGRSDALDMAKRRLKALPSSEALEADIEALDVAVRKPADRRQTRGAVAVPLDGIPGAASQVSPGLIDSVVITLERAGSPNFGGFSMPVLTSAMQVVWSRRKFAPAPCEVLDAARSEWKRYVAARGITEKLLQIRQQTISGKAWKSRRFADFKSDRKSNGTSRRRGENVRDTNKTACSCGVFPVCARARGHSG
jgi:hypothetical protein